jgi:hypothetical protein
MLFSFACQAVEFSSGNKQRELVLLQECEIYFYLAQNERILLTVFKIQKQK